MRKKPIVRIIAVPTINIMNNGIISMIRPADLFIQIDGIKGYIIFSINPFEKSVNGKETIFY